MENNQNKIEDWEKKFDEVFEKVYGATDKTLLLKWLKDSIHDLLIEERKKYKKEIAERIKKLERSGRRAEGDCPFYLGGTSSWPGSDDFWRQAKKNHEKHYKEPNAKLSKARTEDNRFRGFYKFPDQFCPKCEEKMTLEFVSTSGKNIEQTGLKRICQRCKYNDFIKSLDETQFIFSMD